MHSQGFPEGFARWILHEDVVDYVPLNVPSAEWLSTVLLSVKANAVHLSKLQDQQRKQSFSQLFKADWKAGGRLHASAVKGPGMGTLDCLARTCRLHITPLRATWDTSAKFRVLEKDAVVVGSVWDFNKGSARVAEVQDDVAVLDTPPNEFMQSPMVTQRCWTSDHEFIAGEVQSFWHGFWNTEREPVAETERMLADLLPQVPQFSATLSFEEVKVAIRGLQVKKARGMDAWSNGDFKLFSDSDILLLTNFFNAVTLTGEWPDSMLDAAVTLLAKVSQPQSAKDARPITVLSCMFRLWARLMAKKMFNAMIGFLPADLYGSVPGRSAADAAWELQCTLEQAIDEGTGLNGVSLDLSKAYNTIPRGFLDMLAAKAGWPSEVRNAYQAFLSGLRRYFRVHEGVSHCALSKTGVPEGCPIAVVAMILVTWSISLFTEQNSGRMLSYVDNWTALTNGSTRQLLELLRKIKWAADELALLLNPEKTRAFGTQPGDRTALAASSFEGHPLNMCNHFADLGVVFSACKKVTAASLQRRLRDNDAKLKRLQGMPWSANRKSQVLLRVVAPAVFFGTALTSVSMTTMATIRGKFSAAVWGQWHHRNHYLTPLLSCHAMFEPFLIVWKLRFQSLRRAIALRPSKELSRWNLSLTGRSVGPHRYIMLQLAMVDATCSEDFYVTFSSGRVFNLASDDKDVVLGALQESWFSFISTQLQSKPEFAGIGWVDWPLTLQLHTHGHVDMSVWGSFATGAAMFSRQKSKFLSSEASRCCHCGGIDSQRHRLFECPHYSVCRADLPVEMLRTLPELLVERGFVKKPLALQHWEEALSTIGLPDNATFFFEDVSVFTDGSTSGVGSVPKAAWSVVLAEWDSKDYTVVQSGPLPGRQTNYRAELCAVLVALQHMSSGTVYIDNLAVVRGLWRLLDHGWQELYWQKHAERQLWYQVWLVFQPKSFAFWNFVHVKSHRMVAEAKNKHDEWQILHNNAADTVAKMANVSRGSRMARLYMAAQREYRRLQKLVELISILHQRIVDRSSSSPAKKGSSGQSCCLVWDSGFSLSAACVDVSSCLMCPPFLSVLTNWLMAQTWHSSSQPCSVACIFVQFVQDTGWVAPVNVAQWDQTKVPKQWRSNASSAWLHETSFGDLLLMRPTFKKQAKIFLHALKLLVTHFSWPLEFPSSPALTVLEYPQHVTCLSHWPKSLCDNRLSGFSQTVGSLTVKHFLNKPFSPAVRPVPSDLVQECPSTVWNRYHRANRRKTA